MKVTELSRDQLVELKQHYLCDTSYHVYTSELADADNIISDEEIFEEYADTEFTEDDFIWG